MDDQVPVYSVTLLDRAFQDLDGIYEYIANTLVEPNVALNEKANNKQTSFLSSANAHVGAIMKFPGTQGWTLGGRGY